MSHSSSLVLSLAPTPLGDALRSSREEAVALPRYPLDLETCNHCGHAFLPLAVEPEESYTDYAFRTAASPGLKELMGTLAQELWAYAHGRQGDVVLDIGSNDGTFLKAFVDLGARAVGVEPSTPHSRMACEDGIETVNAYFSLDLARVIGIQFATPRVVTIHNVLANIPEPVDFLRGVAEICDDDSIISIVTGYHPDQFSARMFDYIYHEHLSYFTMGDIVRMADACGLRAVAAKRIALKGGSIQVLLKRTRAVGGHAPEIEQLTAWERWSGVNEDDAWRRLRDGIRDSKEWLGATLEGMPQERLWGYGCSHSVTTLIYEFDMADKLTGLVDDNPERHERFAPGSGLRISDPKELAASVEPVVILAWQHDWRIRRRLERMRHRGPAIQFMPRPPYPQA